MTPDKLQQFQKAISEALAKNPDVARFGGTNSTDDILNAYMTGDWSNLTTLTGKPFTVAQQQAAVREAERALSPGFKAQETFDRSVVTDTLNQEQSGVDQFRKDEEKAFRTDKTTMDENSADQGVLFSGSRFQKLNDLRNTYQDREAQNAAGATGRIRNAARDYQYQYGDSAAKGLSDLYKLPSTRTFNANVAGGKVGNTGSVSSVYNPKEFNFQGTTPVSQKASIQTRAASLLGNRANKLTASGYKNKL